MEALMTSLGEGLSGMPMLAVGVALAWGVASMVLSPCHLAGIPLVVGFIHGGGEVKRARAMWMASAFAFGLLLTIALIGLLTAALGRIAGDLGPWANYVVAAIFMLAGLHLLDVLPAPWVAERVMPASGGGPLAAMMLGLVFGIALGPCTFAYLAPVRGVVFGSASDSPMFSLALLLAFGVGHCAVIVIAGAYGGLVRGLVDWNSRTEGVSRFRRGSGVLVVLAGLYLLWTA